MGGPLAQAAHAVNALDVTDDIAKVAPLCAQHAQTPAHFGHHVDQIDEAGFGGHRQPVLEVLVALAADLQVQGQHERRAVGGLGAIDQARHVIAVAHHVELKPERVAARFFGHVFDRADAHGRQGERDAEFFGSPGSLDFAIGAQHAGQTGGCDGHRHGHILPDQGAGGAAVLDVDGDALAQLDALKVVAVGAVGGLGPRAGVDVVIEHARHTLLGKPAQVVDVGDDGHDGGSSQEHHVTVSGQAIGLLATLFFGLVYTSLCPGCAESALRWLSEPANLIRLIPA